MSNLDIELLARLDERVKTSLKSINELSQLYKEQTKTCITSRDTCQTSNNEKLNKLENRISLIENRVENLKFEVRELKDDLEDDDSFLKKVIIKLLEIFGVIAATVLILMKALHGGV